MSKAEILNELPNLTKEERHEIRLLLTKLDGEDWYESARLTESEKALIEARIADYQNDPDSGGSWEEVDKRLLNLLDQIDAEKRAAKQ